MCLEKLEVKEREEGKRSGIMQKVSGGRIETKIIPRIKTNS